VRAAGERVPLHAKIKGPDTLTAPTVVRDVEIKAMSQGCAICSLILSRRTSARTANPVIGIAQESHSFNPNKT